MSATAQAQQVQSKIIGVGSYLPERIVTNDELAKSLDTSDEWISRRTGIRSRHFAADNQATSDLAVAAARDALADANLPARSVDLIIVATVTPDRTTPATAILVQQKLGCGPLIAFDVSAACAGFVHAMALADKLIQSGMIKNALIIGAEQLSCFLDWEDRSTCVLFGDGAGAMVLQASPAVDSPGVIATHLCADASKADILYINGGPSTTGTVGVVRMQGQEVFKAAVEAMTSSLETCLESAKIGVDEIEYLVPHQANSRIVDKVAQRIGVNHDKVVRTVESHGNTSAASIPLAIAELLRSKPVKPGSLFAITAAGSGMTFGAALFRI
jgi:3-oxoacyl-[acyl-carrier-protein] synthase-3